ncbi:MAG: DUF6165 family protein, partial [Verrucomicrobiota bacterium]
MYSDPILVEVSAGELFDKISILEIKNERISDPDKLTNIRAELDALRSAAAGLNPPEAVLAEIKKVNEELWKIEDEIRICESKKEFGDEFVKLARSVYFTNDRESSRCVSCREPPLRTIRMTMFS